MLAEDTARLTLLVNGKWGGFFGLGAAQREMHDLGTRLHESMASGLKGKAILASDLGIGIGGLAASAIAGTAVVASSFQTMTQKIQGNTGITNAQLAQVRQEILKLGSEGSVSLTDLGGAFQQASNEGYRGAAAMNVVKTAWKAAIATGGNAKDITSTLTLVLKDFGISAMHAGRAMAIMMRAAASGDTTLPDVAAHFYKVSVMASGIHMPLATAAASFSELTRATHNAGIAQTYWSGMITHMLNPTKQATTLMEGLKQATGIDLQSAFQKFANGQMSFTNVMALARKATEGNTAVIYKLFGGIRGGIGAVKLLGNGWHDYLSIANQTAHSNNLLQHGFSAMQGTISYQMDTLKNKVQVAAVTMGTA
ncbi:MAG: phage tail tape measure protein, partial [Chloroflexota bacterium]